MATKLNRSEVESLVRDVLRQKLRGQISPPPAVERSNVDRRPGPPNPLVVNVSARHMHVTQSDLEVLFGAGSKLTKREDRSPSTPIIVKHTTYPLVSLNSEVH